MARSRKPDTAEPPADEPQRSASWASSPAVRAVMRGNKGRDTRPELAVRSAAHALGLRYRVGVSPLPGLRRTADLVFTRAKVAVFVDGCFWHGCPEHHRPARQHSEYWTAKIRGNVTRDADTDARLRAAGWQVIRIWEHEPAAAAAARIKETVREARTEPELSRRSRSLLRLMAPRRPVPGQSCGQTSHEAAASAA